MATTPQSETFLADYLELLSAFNERQTDAIIVGGHAVNFWAEIFEETEPGLRQFRPYTSADLDLHRLEMTGQEVLRSRARRVEAERDPFGKAFTIVSHTFLISGKDGRVLPVDHLKMVAGLRAEEVRKGAIAISFSGLVVHVLNQIACLKAKLHNVGFIEQKARQDERHVRMLILCTRGFIRRLIAEAAAAGNYRPTLNAIKQLLNLISRRSVMKIAQAHHIDLSNAVPLTDLKASTDPKLVNFCRLDLPRWQTRLKAKG